jgi:ParD-like antitoxin of type II bacterial toxin-antitoxin system
MLSTAIAATLNASSPTPSNFASVKLSAHMVAHAKAAAAPMRRSVASQIEYWVTLGLALEHNGLTTQEARNAIESYEADVSKTKAQPMAQPIGMDDAAQRKATVAKLKAQMLEAHYSGSLNASLQRVVEDNRQNGLRLAALRLQAA